MTHGNAMYDSQIVSDHMPVWVALVTKTITDTENDKEVKIQNNASPSSWEKWRERASATLHRSEDKIKRKLKSGNITEIDEAVQIFTNISIEEAKRTLKQVENIPPIMLAIRDDTKLHELRREERSARQKFNTHISQDNSEAKNGKKKYTTERKR